jgi:hypothetical protein
MRLHGIVALLLLAGSNGLSGPAPVSDPIGLYAVVEKVVMEPSESAPERIQVWGAFAVAETTSPDAYSAPQTGYLYYRCQSGQETTCRNEWADLKSVAGKGIGVGFGGRRTPTGRVRKASDKPSDPDPYPIRMGVVRMGSMHDQASIVSALKQALVARPR